ncbi:MAG: class A beta-lactamase-related serine hydrolase, partial [Parvularculaceae bacterium]
MLARLMKMSRYFYGMLIVEWSFLRKILAAVFIFTAMVGLTACEKQPFSQPDTGAEQQFQSLTTMISDRAAESGFSGVVLIANNGEIIFEKAYNHPDLLDTDEITIDSQFAIASMTKSFTAILVLQLIEAGQISLDTRLDQLLPDYAAEYANQVTVRHMLQNRSGIPHYIDLPGWFDSDYKRSLTDDTFIAAIAHLPLKFPPDTDYLYSNANFFLLGLILEEVTGLSYETLLKEKILEPVGLTDTGQIYETQPNATLARNFMLEGDETFVHIPIINPRLFRATASLYSTGRDLHRWHEALADGTLLSGASKGEMFNPETPMAWTIGALPLSNDVMLPLQTYNGILAAVFIFTAMVGLTACEKQPFSQPDTGAEQQFQSL